MLAICLAATAAIALAASYRTDPTTSTRAVRQSVRAQMQIMPNLLTMTALVGLIVALLPPGALAALFHRHGLAGFALVSSVGALVTMPAPIAYPLAGALYRQGVSLAALASFITTLTMVGVVTAPMEAQYFGRRFVVARQALSFALALAIGAAMGGILR